MPEPDIIPISASTASTGFGVRYVGNRTYAYSGSTDATDSTTPISMLKYTSGAKTDVVSFQFFDVDIGSHQRVVQIKLNGQIVIQSNYDGTDPSFHNERYRLVIPPVSEVEFLGNINGSVVAMYVSMTGRVYGAA
jgi:hypothetical protein